jgi:hypothetical protein
VDLDSEGVQLNSTTPSIQLFYVTACSDCLQATSLLADQLMKRSLFTAEIDRGQHRFFSAMLLWQLLTWCLSIGVMLI